MLSKLSTLSIIDGLVLINFQELLFFHKITVSFVRGAPLNLYTHISNLKSNYNDYKKHTKRKNQKQKKKKIENIELLEDC